MQTEAQASAQAPAQPSQIDLEALFDDAFSSAEGLMAFASSMANPIRFTLDYQAIGRRLMFVDPLATGQVALYDFDFKVDTYVVSKRGQVPDKIIETDRIQVPTHELASFPSIRYSHIREKRFNLIERAQTRAKLDLMQLEDQEIFSVINAAATTGRNPSTIQAGSAVLREGLIAALGEVVKWDLPLAYITMNTSEYTDILRWTRDDFDPVTQREVITTGLIGHLWNAALLESKMVPRSRVLLTSAPEFVGVIPIRQDVNVVPADKPEKLRIGFVVYEELGFTVTNDRGVSKLELGTPKTPFTPF